MTRLMRGFRTLVRAAAAVFATAHAAHAVELLNKPDLYIGAPFAVHAVARQPDGGVILGGSFEAVNGVPRANLARLRPDGTLDPDWNPSTDGAVRAIVVDGTSVYIGGAFARIGGQARSRVAKLDGATGAVAADWNPAPNGDVNTIAAVGGEIYVGGWFDHVGAETRVGLAKLSAANGAVDAAWRASCDTPYKLLVVDTFVYVAGACLVEGTSGGAVPQLARVTRLNGALDLSWNPEPDDFVFGLAADGAGNLYASGQFQAIGGAARAYLARVSPTTGRVDAAWHPQLANAPSSIALVGSALFVGGYSSGAGNVARAGVARLDLVDGTAHAAWQPDIDGGPVALAPFGVDKIVAAGLFTRADDTLRVGVALFNAGGGLEPIVANVGKPATVRVLARQPDGGMIVAGDFQRIGAYGRGALARLLPDGGLDREWVADVDAPVRAVAINPAGEIYVGGEFRVIGGYPRAGLAKLAADGTVDQDWHPDVPVGGVSALALDAAGSVYVAGTFGTIGGVSRSNLAKLDGARIGAVDALWNPSPDASVRSLALDRAGALYVGGDFAQIGGQSRAHLARLATSGSGAADPAWDADTDGAVTAIVARGNAVFVAGRYTTIGGQPRRQIAKLARGSGVDMAWNPSAVVATVDAIALDGAGDVYAAGAFSAVTGTPATQSVMKFPGSGAQTHDPSWRPEIGGAVYVVTADRDEIRVGGAFAVVEGQARYALAAFDSAMIFADGYD